VETVFQKNTDLELGSVPFFRTNDTRIITHITNGGRIALAFHARTGKGSRLFDSLGLKQ